jgi:hypothetical protein
VPEDSSRFVDWHSLEIASFLAMTRGSVCKVSAGVQHPIGRTDFLNKSSNVFANNFSIAHICFMAKRYRFSKAFIICTDNRVFGEQKVSNFFSERKNAEETCKSRQVRSDEEAKMAYWPKDKPVPKLTVHGFYLVHESLFDEILKEHSK